MVQKYLLELEMAKKGISVVDLANDIGISTMALRNKINGVSEFKASEIMAIRKELDLTSAYVENIFFAENLTENGES